VAAVFGVDVDVAQEMITGLLVKSLVDFVNFRYRLHATIRLFASSFHDQYYSVPSGEPTGGPLSSATVRCTWQTRFVDYYLMILRRATALPSFQESLQIFDTERANIEAAINLSMELRRYSICLEFLKLGHRIFHARPRLFMVTLYERLVDVALSHQRNLLVSTVDGLEHSNRAELCSSDELGEFGSGGLLGDLPFLMNELGRAYVSTGNISNAERAYKNSLDLMAAKAQAILSSSVASAEPPGDAGDDPTRANEIRNLNKFRAACLHRLGEVYITSCRYSSERARACQRLPSTRN